MIVGGRCVSDDNISHSAMWNMMACTVTGQGAGVASSVSVKKNTLIRNVDVKAVQEELINQGVIIYWNTYES